MTPKRLSIKFFAQDADDIEIDPFMEVFQRWIQQQRLEGLLIDVVDYKHVHHGPGIILIGDEADYGFDLGEGRPGLLYTRKRQMPDALVDALADCTRMALAACQNLEIERAFKPRSFDYSEIKISFQDRLNLPNVLATFETIKPELETFAALLFGDADVTITMAASDPREALSITLKADAPIEAETLLERLKAQQAAS